MLTDWVSQCRIRIRRPRGLLIAVLFGLLSVTATTHQAGANILDGGVAQYDPNMDYFPDKVRVQHATGFTVSYHRHYKVVTVLNPWQHAKQTEFIPI